MSRTVYITRHGQSEHNENTAVFMGRAPSSRLVEKGREQARRLGRRLARAGGVEHIVASSLPRTEETARIVAEHAGGVVHLEDAFWELSKGHWEGRMPRELPPEVQAAFEADPMGFAYGEGESYADVVRRVGPAFDGWLERLSGGCVLFVLHGDVIRALLYHLIAFPPGRIADFAMDPCALSEVAVAGARRRVIRLNDSCHLDGAFAEAKP